MHHFHGQTEFLGGNLRHHRLHTLTDFGRADGHINAAVFIDFDKCGRCGRARGRWAFNHTGQAFAVVRLSLTGGSVYAD